MEGKFHDKLKVKIHLFITYSYSIAEKFPKEEKFGLVSQLCRAAISVMLNYVEGFARRRIKVKLNFYEISHGSCQECKYIFFFAFSQKWICKEEYDKAILMTDEIGRMLWSTIDFLEKEEKNMLNSKFTY